MSVVGLMHLFVIRMIADILFRGRTQRLLAFVRTLFLLLVRVGVLQAQFLVEGAHRKPALFSYRSLERLDFLRESLYYYVLLGVGGGRQILLQRKFYYIGASLYRGTQAVADGLLGIKGDLLSLNRLFIRALRITFAHLVGLKPTRRCLLQPGFRKVVILLISIDALSYF